MSKPKEAKITERKKIMAYLQALNPQDTFRFQESDLFPDFKADKPYSTGLKYNKNKHTTYYMTSNLGKNKPFQMNVNWNDDWQKVTVNEGVTSYLSALLGTAITHDLRSKLNNPKKIFTITVEESLYRRVRERVRTMADVRALLKREKYWINVHTQFSMEVNDYNVFNDDKQLKQLVLPYMKALQDIHYCSNKMRVEFHWSQGKGDSYRSEFKHLELSWHADGLYKDADFMKLADKAIKHSINK